MRIHIITNVGQQRSPKFHWQYSQTFFSTGFWVTFYTDDKFVAFPSKISQYSLPVSELLQGCLKSSQGHLIPVWESSILTVLNSATDTQVTPWSTAMPGPDNIFPANSRGCAKCALQ
jgi:hypothetical protein